MISPLTPMRITRLSQIATSAGFDLERGPEGGWLHFESSQCPLRIWLASVGDDVFIAALSMDHVVRALEGYALIKAPLPPEAAGGRSASNLDALYTLLRRAFQLSRSLPNEPLHTFQARIASMPKKTEVERLQIVRVGQDIFRQALLDYWQGRCAITGLAIPALLRASHSKPWSDCESDAERLDVYNGLLLAPHFDALFDRGFITVADDGALIHSPRLDEEARIALGVAPTHRVVGLREQHTAYLRWHRERVFDHLPTETHAG